MHHSTMPMAAASRLSPATHHIPFNPELTAHIPPQQKCSNTEEAKQVHAEMIKTGLVHRIIPASKLLTALCETSLAYSLKFFNRIQEPNTFMWNTIIRGFSDSQNQDEAISLYCQMLYNAAPHNLYTFPFLIKACTLEEILQIHCHVIKFGFASELYAVNSLLHAYAKSGSIVSAKLLFDRIPCKDIVSWNSIIEGYAKTGQIEKARRLFDQMGEKNLISWTSMINGYVVNCLFKEALEVFHEMQETGVEPDKVTLTCALSACAQLGTLEQGQWIHAYIKKKRIELDQVLGCVLVDMYAKCGELDQATAIFKKIEERRCVSLWTAMITGFAVHGQGREAFDLFEDMEKKGIRPNEITFTGVLTACSYSGLVEEGKSLFKKMVKGYKIRPSIEHYGCMVDLFGRAGLLKEAEDFISAMPVKPNAIILGSLLTACRIHGDYDRGTRVGKNLITLEPNHGGRYINLANIFAADGEWGKATNVRKVMKERQVSKLPGSSLISLNGRAHEFLAGDKSHPELAKIHVEGSKIMKRLEEEGYVPETEELLLDLEEEEKETAVHCHSEKLAITFGLIRTESSSTIRVIKNLRVCRDCHNVSKLISKVYGRKIVMRDRSRFHIFEDGRCTCRDYW